MTGPRVLLAITVYNGRASYPAASSRRCAASATTSSTCWCSTTPAPAGVQRPLAAVRAAGSSATAPRATSASSATSTSGCSAPSSGYDHVIIANSDVVFPSNLVTGMIAVAETDEHIGSVTAWSTNVSAYSLPNVDPDQLIDEQVVVDWLSASPREFGHGAMDVPAGISFSILIPPR